ncbi:MAG: hypothetical protein A2341_13665 [Deltaproteobacteria bacterium RIFOXYB12_FULL_58_9]|nr:MAG: hypothetical protein A2341_13665 [Deltaproteobacteria bacterium RIFOXYB12_FULL_58_9]
MPSVTISARLLMERINRKLVKDKQRVRKTRDDRGYEQYNLGDYWIQDDSRGGAVLETYVDLVALGRKLDVLTPREEVVGCWPP